MQFFVRHAELNILFLLVVFEVQNASGAVILITFSLFVRVHSLMFLNSCTSGSILSSEFWLLSLTITTSTLFRHSRQLPSQQSCMSLIYH